MTGSLTLPLERPRTTPRDGLAVIPAVSVLQPRDEQHALALLREAGHCGTDDELTTLARRAVQGTVLLVRPDDTQAPAPDDDPAADAPMLTQLMAVC